MSLVIGGLIAGSLYTLVALGLILIVRVTGAINFAQGDAGSVGTFVAIRLVGSSVGLPLAGSVIIGLLSGAAVNLVIYLLFVRRLEKAGSGPLPTMVVTIGASLIIQALLTLQFGFNPYTLALFRNIGSVRLFGENVPGSGTMIVASAVLAILVFAFVLYRTKFGRILRMGASNPMLAELRGIHTVFVRMIVWAVAGLIATWGVMLYASYQTISTSVMGGFLLTAAVAASWGAFKSLSLTLAGAISLGIMFDIVARYVQADVTYMITFVVLSIVFLIYQLRSGRLLSRADASGVRLTRSWFSSEVRPSYRIRPGIVFGEGALVIIGLVLWLFLTPSGSYSQSLAMEVGVALTALAGLSVSFKFARRLTLGAGGFMCLGAYSYVVLGLRVGVVFALVITMVASFAIGFLLGLLTAGMELMFYATLTLVFTTALPELVDVFSRYTNGTQGMTIPLNLTTGNPAWVIVLASLAATIVTVVGGLTRSGSATLIASGDRRLAHANGLHDTLRLALAEGVSGALMALAGVLLAVSVGYIDPASFDLSLSVGLIAALIVGGGWSIIGLVLGSIFYVLVPAELSTYQGYPDVVYGGILILVVLIAPVGLEGVTTWLYVERRWWANSKVGSVLARWKGTRYADPHITVPPSEPMANSVKSHDIEGAQDLSV